MAVLSKKHASNEEGTPVPRMAARDDLDALDDASPTTNRVRQGVTGYNVRYVLLFGTVGAALGILIVGLAFFG
ncbi:MAG TPA: hypothetical protein VH933_10590 [Aestuariivirgaceae bacterium]